METEEQSSSALKRDPQAEGDAASPGSRPQLTGSELIVLRINVVVTEAPVATPVVFRFHMHCPLRGQQDLVNGLPPRAVRAVIPVRDHLPAHEQIVLIRPELKRVITMTDMPRLMIVQPGGVN